MHKEVTIQKKNKQHKTKVYQIKQISKKEKNKTTDDCGKPSDDTADTEQEAVNNRMMSDERWVEKRWECKSKAS